MLWSYPGDSFSPYWSYKLQWKSGNQEYDSSRELVIDWFSREHRRMLNSAALDQYRRIGRITGLTPGTEYTVRVVVVDPDGNASSPSPEATGTPQLSPDQGFNLIEDEIIDRFETSSPWLRSTWNYLHGRAVTWNFLGGAYVETPCSSVEDGLRKCDVTRVALGLGTYTPVGYAIIHELAHAYTLANGAATNPGPVAIGHVYISKKFDTVGNLCQPHEVYADLVAINTYDPVRGPRDGAFAYWAMCKHGHPFEQEALDVARGAAEGRMPSWFAATYHDAEDEPDLERLWADVKAMANSRFRAAAVYQLRNEFGGYCDRRKATESAFENGVTRNPWRDGGCVPGAPLDMTAAAVDGGKLTVSWNPPADDGGSPIEGYKVQWKSGTEAYDSSRQGEVTDLERLSHTIEGLTSGVEYSVRAVAYNHNGDGADSVETTVTAAAQDTTAPQLSAATADGASLVLTWNETLDETSVPAPGVFEVSAGGSARAIGGVAVAGNRGDADVDLGGGRGRGGDAELCRAGGGERDSAP